MKKFIPHILGLAMAALVFLPGCKKEKTEVEIPELTYEQRLAGRWDLQSVKYQAEFPNPYNPMENIEVDDKGENVLGVFDLEYNPNTVSYSYSFTASVQLSDTIPPMSIPVQRSGEGTWTTTSDESALIITEGEETYTLKVLTNENKRQVYSTTIPQDVFGVMTVNVDTELEFVR